MYLTSWVEVASAREPVRLNLCLLSKTNSKTTDYKAEQVEEEKRRQQAYVNLLVKNAIKYVALEKRLLILIFRIEHYNNEEREKEHRRREELERFKAEEHEKQEREREKMERVSMFLFFISSI